MDEEQQDTPTEAQPQEKPGPSTPTDGNAQDIECCFIVVIGREGGSTVVLDPSLRFNAARIATPQDIYGALANCLADWQAMKNGEAVVALQQQMAQQIAAQAQAEALRQRLFPGPGPGPAGGLGFPPR
jgi:hypothetical protein